MKYKVKVGTLGFEQGIFQAGSTIDITPARAAIMDPNDIELIQETPTPAVVEAPKPVEVKPEPAETPKPRVTAKKKPELVVE